MPSDPAARPGPKLSVVAPTYREAKNVPVLFEKLRAALAGLEWDLVVVDDDSPDGTWRIAQDIAKADGRMRCLRRVNRYGLAGAVIEGWLSSSADYVCVIDGDLQHDERIIPAMLEALRSGQGNMAIGTRVEDQAAPAGFSPWRAKLSEAATQIFQRMSGAKVTDPMSGFFMVERMVVARHAAGLSPDGFKILVDVLLSAREELKIVETPYVFRPREAGESKLSALVGLEFLGLIAHHWARGWISTRFLMFALVGGVGVFVHLLALGMFLLMLGDGHFRSAQALATLLALMSNFVLNNEITYRSRRYKGAGLILGFATFALLCSVGVFANLDISSWLFRSEGLNWGLAGVAGALVNVVWNYAVSTTFVWRRRG